MSTLRRYDSKSYRSSLVSPLRFLLESRPPPDLTRGLDRLDRAIALKPSDSTLLFNGAATAIRDAVGGEFDFKALKSRADWDALAFLYRTPDERAAIMKRIANHPATVKGRAYADKVVLLSPKRDESYQLIQPLLENARDLPGLKDLIARAEKAGSTRWTTARSTWTTSPENRMRRRWRI